MRIIGIISTSNRRKCSRVGTTAEATNRRQRIPDPRQGFVPYRMLLGKGSEPSQVWADTIAARFGTQRIQIAVNGRNILGTTLWTLGHCMGSNSNGNTTTFSLASRMAE